MEALDTAAAQPRSGERM